MTKNKTHNLHTQVKEERIQISSIIPTTQSSNMKIKSFILVLIALFSLCGEVVKAYDLSYTHLGKTLYYDTTSSNTVKVVGYSSSINGGVMIPLQFTYNSTHYSVTAVGDSAFTNCSNLTSISIPSTITYIGNYAFYGCGNLTSVTISGSVTEIGHNAFEYCISLTNITLPNTVTSIGYCAFSRCISLISITIPNSITNIDKSTFSYCSSLTSVTIPNSVTSIDNAAFRNCSSLTSITIPNSVTSIGYYTFRGCSSLTSIEIPSSVTSITEGAFSCCSSLTSITVQSGNTEYDSRDNCNAIIEKSTNKLIAGCTNTIIPSSVTSIGFSAFQASGLTSIIIPNSVTSIGSCAFDNCSSLTSVTIPNSVTFIGGSAFSDCSSLTSITIPNSIDSIGKGTFWGCTSFKSITLPSSITSINEEAFGDCTNLDTIISENTTPPSVIWGAFWNVPNDLVLLVPCSAINSYKTANIWSTFTNIHSIDILEEINVTICADETYNFSGQIVSLSGTYTKTIQTTNGCDSVITLTLAVNPIYTESMEMTICGNESYYFVDTTLTSAGTYTKTLQTISGCDSVVTLTLNVNPIYTENIEATICEGETYTFGTQTLTKAGEYIQKYNTINGCDSTIKLTLTVNPTYIDTIEAAINSGETYQFGTQTLSKAGEYIRTIQTIDGCDSIIVLKLTVLSGIDDIETSQITMYPNPTNEKVYLTLTDIPNATITIMDIQGNIVKKEEVLANETEVVLDVKDLASGTYTIMISNDKTRVTKKLIKR